MSALPTITLPSAIALPAVAAQTASTAFVSSLNASPDPGQGKPWPYTSTLSAIDANGNYIINPLTGKTVTHTIKRDLRLDSATFPAVAQLLAGGGSLGMLAVIELLHAVDPLEQQIVAGLADLKTKTDTLTRATASATSAANEVTRLQTQITSLNANTTLSSDVQTAALANETAALVRAQTAATTATAAQTATNTAYTAAVTLVWVTLLGQWRAAATPLGVTDPHALPSQLTGLTVPAGVTI